MYREMDMRFRLEQAEAEMREFGMTLGALIAPSAMHARPERRELTPPH
jgi:hypothetical protein